jgi:sulfhydrogenase subunit alpha
MSDRRDISIKVPVLARVEGEGALELEVRDGEITDLKLRIFEPPRLFEKFLEGRAYHEVPDFVARICGICPVAYQMSAVHAIEQVFECDPGAWVRSMRRLLYCGEWLESHSLHIHLLALPDFLGFSSVTEMAKQYPDEVRRGLALQEVGNSIVSFFGGRSVHPVGVRVGGFHKAPTPDDAKQLLHKVRERLADAEALLRWCAQLELPDIEQKFVSVATRHAGEYPMNEGRIVSGAGHDLGIEQFQDHFQEQQAPHSTALHCHLDDQPYLVGPLARLNLNHDRLPGSVQALLQDCGISFPDNNMFHSLVARAVEIYYALFEAQQILENYSLPDSPYVDVTPQAGVGYGCTEAPRGMLWHRYELDEAGHIISAVIVPPTSQNQARIEADLRQSLTSFGLDQDDAALRLHAETVVRNYDPCISCSTHFLDLRVNRS